MFLPVQPPGTVVAPSLPPPSPQVAGHMMSNKQLGRFLKVPHHAPHQRSATHRDQAPMQRVPTTVARCALSAARSVQWHDGGGSDVYAERVKPAMADLALATLSTCRGKVGPAQRPTRPAPDMTFVIAMAAHLQGPTA